MADQEPDLATLTQLPAPKPGEYTRRARSLLPGERANRLPAVIPAQLIFRISPDSPHGRATIRKWGRRHGWKVKDRGPVPAGLVAAFMEEHGIWTVYIRRAWLPNGRGFSDFYQVKQGEFLRNLEHGKSETIDPDKIKRVMGRELFAMLKQVET